MNELILERTVQSIDFLLTYISSLPLSFIFFLLLTCNVPTTNDSSIFKSLYKELNKGFLMSK